MSHAKDPERRQRRNLPKIIEGEVVPDRDAGGDAVAVPPASAGYDVPVPPPGLRDAWMQLWRGLWTSPVARLLDPVSDYPPAARLFRLYVLGDRLDDQIDAAGVVDTGLVSSRVKCATEARLIEAQLGLSPRSRLALGLALLAGRRGSGGDGAGGGVHDDAND